MRMFENDTLKIKNPSSPAAELGVFTAAICGERYLQRAFLLWKNQDVIDSG